jgi:hypothetical protein
MYCLMSNTIFKSCPKLIIYLVSKTWIPMFLKISSKVFFGDIVCGVNWISYLLTTHWFISSSKPTQFEWNGPLNSTNVCDIKSLPYSSLIIWTKESRICSSICQSTIVFAFINLHSLSTCYSSTWLRVVTRTITLTSTLSGLENLANKMAIVVGLVRNMF